MTTKRFPRQRHWSPLCYGRTTALEALVYFQKYTDENLGLDELYISHGKLREREVLLTIKK